ncbi:beta-lactamase-like protein [Gongronella butleri]|nr:beta-lactamase-like protein [Gongronella butleri]
MKVSCIASECFLIEIGSSTILVNCPLEVDLRKPKPAAMSGSAPSSMGRPVPPPTAASSSSASHGAPSQADVQYIMDFFDQYAPHAKQAQQARLDQQHEQQQQQQQQEQAMGSDRPFIPVFRMVPLPAISHQDIDLIIITHFEAMLGLPYLTEYLGYHKRIVATEPTIMLARQRMQELVAYFSDIPAAAASIKRGPTDMDWKGLYSAMEIEECLARIQPLRHDERMSLFHMLTATPKSSGYTLGSSNWVLEAEEKKVAIFASSSQNPHFYPSSLDLTLLDGADVVLVCGVGRYSMDELDKQVSKAISYICSRLKTGDNVVLAMPVVGGLVYDMLWMIRARLAQLGMEFGAVKPDVPVYMLSPVAKLSLEYANICGEWMSQQRMDSVLQAQQPLPHGAMLQDGALTTFADINEIRTSKTKLNTLPSLVITGDAQVLGYGPLDSIMQMWTPEKSVCMLLDPDMSVENYELQKHLSTIPTIHHPMDTRMNLEDVLNAIHTRHECTPEFILLPQMAVDGATATATTSAQELSGIKYIHYNIGGRQNIDITAQWVEMMVYEHMIMNSQLKPIPVNEQRHMVLGAPVGCQIHKFNNVVTVHPSSMQAAPPLAAAQALLPTDDLVNKLIESGHPHVSYTTADNDVTITVNSQADESYPLGTIHIAKNEYTISSTDDHFIDLIRKILTMSNA